MAELGSRVPLWFSLMVLSCAVLAFVAPFVAVGGFVTFVVMVATGQDASVAFWAGVATPVLVGMVTWPVTVAGNAAIKAFEEGRRD